MLNFKNGRFRIMQIADIQEIPSVSPDTVSFIEAAITQLKPDLVVLSGDQVKSYGVTVAAGNRKNNIEKTLNKVLAPIEKSGVPFAYTYGNHDIVPSLGSEFEDKIYESCAGCVNTSAFDRLDKNEGVHIAVYDEGSKSALLSVILIDSHAKVSGKYTGVTEEQINWVGQTCEKLEAQNGKRAPAIIFQHIPVYEMYDLLKETDKNTPGAIEGNYTHRRKYYTVTDEMRKRGEYMLENIACGEKTRQLESWQATGSVKCAFFGHDHINSFTGTLGGVLLGYTPGAGFNVYGPGLDRAVRIIDFDENGSFCTKTVTRKDLLGTKVKAPLRLFFFTHAPSSVDAAKPFIAKALGVLSAGAAAAAALKLIKRK